MVLVNFANVLNLEQIIDTREGRHIVNKYFIIDHEKIMYKLNNINYSSFNSIRTEQDLKNLNFSHVFNFIIDNRKGMLDLFSIKKGRNLEDIPLDRLIKFSNFKNWFNYLELVSFLTHIASTKK